MLNILKKKQGYGKTYAIVISIQRIGFKIDDLTIYDLESKKSDQLVAITL